MPIRNTSPVAGAGRVSARRRLLLASVGASVAAPRAWARPARPGGAITVAQLVDISAAQQDVSKDFLVGSRAAWQDIQARGGVRGRPVTHLAVEVDGTPGSLRSALATLLDDPACVVLCGSAGAPLAARVAAMLAQEATAIAHAAPWLQDSTPEAGDRTFPIFATRQEQIAHALRSLITMGVADVGAVYASEDDHRLHHADIERTAAALRLRLRAFRAAGQLARLGQQLTPGTPAILLFIGGTPELVQFTQGLERQQRQRYVIALADVNLQTVMQMGGARSTPVIATQAVPMVTAPLPVVRAYRETLARLFDEPPAPLSLAGFIAARYTFEVLREIEGPPTRQAVLAAFQRRTAMDVGGYRVAFEGQRRAGAFVTQSMLTVDGRVVG